MPTPTPDFPRQSLDLAFRTLWKHRPDVPRRMAHAGWTRHGPLDGLPVRSVAVLLDPRPGLPTSYVMSHEDEVIGTYAYRVVALSTLDVDGLLDVPDVQAGLLALVPLANGATTAHVAQAARRSFRTVCAARFGNALDALVERVPEAVLNDAIAATAAAVDLPDARAQLTALLPD